MDSFKVSIVIKEREFTTFGAAVNYVQGVRNLVPDAVVQVVSTIGSEAPIDPEIVQYPSPEVAR